MIECLGASENAATDFQNAFCCLSTRGDPPERRRDGVRPLLPDAYSLSHPHPCKTIAARVTYHIVHVSLTRSRPGVCSSTPLLHHAKVRPSKSLHTLLHCCDRMIAHRLAIHWACQGREYGTAVWAANLDTVPNAFTLWPCFAWSAYDHIANLTLSIALPTAQGGAPWSLHALNLMLTDATETEGPSSVSRIYSI